MNHTVVSAKRRDFFSSPPPPLFFSFLEQPTSRQKRKVELERISFKCLCLKPQVHSLGGLQTRNMDSWTWNSAPSLETENLFFGGGRGWGGWWVGGGGGCCSTNKIQNAPTRQLSCYVCLAFFFTPVRATRT